MWAHEPTYHTNYNGAWQTENKIHGIVHRIMAAKRQEPRRSIVFDDLLRETRLKRVSPPCDAIRIGNIIMQHTLEKNGYIRCGIIHPRTACRPLAYEKVLK